MVERIIVWTETAAIQRREILKYWTVKTGSTTYAEKLLKIIKIRLDIILTQPESFKLSSYPNTRESALENFSLFYQIENEKIIVTAFWDNRQNPEKLLKLLKNQ